MSSDRDSGLAALTKPRILFVEDESTLRVHLAEALSDEYCVDTAANGTEALKSVMRTKPELIVTDIVMPQMDGVELLKVLRSAPSTQGIPVLLISGRAAEEQRIEGFREGADGYLSKPYSERELRALIGSMIHSARQRAEAVRREAREESERRAVTDRAALLESITDAFFALDRQWRYTYINQRALDYYGKSPDEILGRSIWEVFPVAAGTRLQQEYQRALSTKSSIAFETVSPVTGRWVDVRVYPTGQGLAVHFRDVSTRKRAEEDLRQALVRLEGREWRLALATKVAGLGVFSWDRHTDLITFENEPPAEISKITQETILTGSHFLKRLLHPADRGAMRRALTRSLRSAEPLRSECRIRTAEGSWRCVQVSAGCQQADDGTPANLVGVVQDVTERREAEESLRASDRRKDEFLALLSHELRNPLAPIANGLSILRYRASSDPLEQNTLNIMDRQVKHLVRLVDDLLDVSRITHGKLQLQNRKMRLLEILERAAEDCRAFIEKCGHELTLNLQARDLVVEGDPDRLEQVFENLIANSSKYTDPGGKIHINLEREHDEAVISVVDNGVGIPADALGQVFEMFSQVRSRQPRAQGGLGVGLALVRTVVEMHGGSINAVSAGPGMGSTFTVRLPLAQTDLPVASREAVDTPPRDLRFETLRALIVEDNADVAASLRDLLELKGCVVSIAPTGEEALERARTFRPEVVFMDLGLPGIDGVETARRIHALDDMHELPIVALTGWGQPADRARTQEAGMVAHLVKPVALDSIERVLARLSCRRPGRG